MMVHLKMAVDYVDLVGLADGDVVPEPPPGLLPGVDDDCVVGWQVHLAVGKLLGIKEAHLRQNKYTNIQRQSRSSFLFKKPDIMLTLAAISLRSRRATSAVLKGSCSSGISRASMFLRMVVHCLPW